MKILVLGGTRFVGRHIVEAALAGGHSVTLFNRGQTNPDLFPDVETLKGDRDGGLDVLRGRRWDAVVDTYGMVPRLVRASTEILKSAAEQYVFISTLAVYADYANPVSGEELPLRELSDPRVEELTGDTYGGLKVLCERAAQEVFGPGALIIRPGFIVGPWDATDRFTYWMRRIQRGGEMLAPGQPDDPMQVIDARDLAHFVVRLVEHRVVDTFNVAGPSEPTTWGTCFELARQITSSDARFTWVDDAFISAHEITDELPMWPPPDMRGVMQAPCTRARAAGLVFRPLASTIRDTLDWDAHHGTPKAGLSREREAALLDTWHEALEEEQRGMR